MREGGSCVAWAGCAAALSEEQAAPMPGRPAPPKRREKGGAETETKGRREGREREESSSPLSQGNGGVVAGSEYK